MSLTVATKATMQPKKHRGVLTCGRSDTYLAQCRIRRMASMLVSGKEALHANSDRHFTASWKESMVAGKCFSKTFARRNGTQNKTG